MSRAPPSSIIIVGAGVFGLSTALAILDSPSHATTHVTVLDSSPILPNPHGSSVDASRIIRADYAHASYAKLACLAQESWRDTSPTGWGGQGRYSESGFVLTGDAGQEAYVKASMSNVQDLARQGLPMQLDKIQALPTRDAIRKVTRLPGVSGDTGYANWNSGWADAEACVAFAIHKLKTHKNAHRLTIRPGSQVVQLAYEADVCVGAHLRTEHGAELLRADLTILAGGAWTPDLLDLRDKCVATGQVLAYLRITPEEQRYLSSLPVIINFARGTFIIPPHTNELKIARHGFGYCNPTATNTSLPRTDTHIPQEAETCLRAALAELFPPEAELPDGCPASLLDIFKRPFVNTRLCWYTDTPTGDFLVDYVPGKKGLFVATGGSGHGFKFLPILGRWILDAVEGKLDEEYRSLWAWRDGSEVFSACKDGSRGGPMGMNLEEELAKGVAQVEVEQHIKAKL